MVKPKEKDKSPVKPRVKPQAPLLKVEALAEEKGMPGWDTAGLMRFAGWSPGKEVTAGEFEKTLSAYRTRRQGGGRM